MRDFFRVGVMSHFIPLRSLPEFPFRESCKWGDKSGGMKRNKGLIYASRRKRGIAPDGPVGGAGDATGPQLRSHDKSFTDGSLRNVIAAVLSRHPSPLAPTLLRKAQLSTPCESPTPSARLPHLSSNALFLILCCRIKGMDVGQWACWVHSSGKVNVRWKNEPSSRNKHNHYYKDNFHRDHSGVDGFGSSEF